MEPRLRDALQLDEFLCRRRGECCRLSPARHRGLQFGADSPGGLGLRRVLDRGWLGLSWNPVGENHRRLAAPAPGMARPLWAVDSTASRSRVNWDSVAPP